MIVIWSTGRANNHTFLNETYRDAFADVTACAENEDPPCRSRELQEVEHGLRRCVNHLIEEEDVALSTAQNKKFRL
jgi:hypothetical protein